MHKHLQRVREFHQQFAIAQADYGDNLQPSDTDILSRQALLQACNSETTSALAAEHMPKVLEGLLDLAFNALAAIAYSGENLVSTGAKWRQDGSELSVARALSDKVNQCLSGEAVHYSALYNLCQQVALQFVQADFDAAFEDLYQRLSHGQH